MTTNKLAYFSMADPSVAGLAKKRDFDKSLISNLLFQEQILITDVYFFSSPNVKKHILENKNGKSIIEAGIEHGFVIPSFRDKKNPTFTETLSRIKRTKIKGVIEGSETVAGLLQKAADKNKDYSPTFWPDYSIGVEFAKLVNAYMERKKPLPVGSDTKLSDKKVWELSKKWRIDLVKKAIKSAPNPNKDGLRRGELYSLIAEELGSRNSKDIQPSDLIKLTPKKSYERELVKVFCTWINTLYQYNQAINFSASTNFPSYDSTITALATELLGKSLPDKRSSEEEKLDLSIGYKIYLPSLKAISSVKTNTIMQIRNETGRRYFYDLEVWQGNPTSSNKQDVIRSLEVYNKELKKLFSKTTSAKEYLVEVLLQTQSPQSKKLLLTTLDILTLVASTQKDLYYFPAMILLSEFGFALYNWVGHINNHELTLTTDKPTPCAEINAPK